MKISIVTPSYNQAKFIARTMDSVLSQTGKFELEYIIIDGGSKDGSVELIRQYAERDARIQWVSEPDKGQSDAINKGLRRASGDIVAFLNSDDTYEPDCLAKVANYFAEHPEVQWVTGRCTIINENDQPIRPMVSMYKNVLLKHYSQSWLLSENFISQPATFWRGSVHAKLGYLNEQEHFCMDYDFWLRLSQLSVPGVLYEPLARFRFYPQSKSGSFNKQQFQDELRLAHQYGSNHRWILLLHRLNYYKIMTAYRLFRLFE